MGTQIPRLTRDELRTAVGEMSGQAAEMLRLTREAFLQPFSPFPSRVAEIGREIHDREKRLTGHVALQLREFPWSLGPAEHLVFLPAALERVGDCAEALNRAVQSIHRDGIPFSEQATRDVIRLFNGCAELLEGIETALRTNDRTPLAAVVTGGQAVRSLCDQTAAGHQERLIQGVCAPRASSIFLAMLDYFREIDRYAQRMVPALEKALVPA